MFRLPVLILLLSFFTFQARAQQISDPPVQTKYLSPYDHIKNLQHGAMLVRLKTAQHKIDALNKMGKTQWAKKIIREQKAENQKLVDAFKKYYTFSPVYFFFSDDSEKVRNKQFKGVLYDVNLQPVFENDSFPGRFLVAEIGLIGSGQSSFNEAGEQIDESSQNSTITGLVVSDQNLVQLTDPFPYFVRSYNSLGEDLRRTEDRMVQKLNAKLFEFSRIHPTALKSVSYDDKRDTLKEEKDNAGKISVAGRILLAIGRTLNAIF